MVSDIPAGQHQLLGAVLGRVKQVLPDDEAEDVAVSATARFISGDRPRWLRPEDERTRLDVLVCLEIGRYRRRR